MQLAPLMLAAVFFLVALDGFFPAKASAQQSVDPRLAAPMIEAAKAEIALRDAALRAAAEDQAKRERDLAEWFRGYFTPEKEAK